MYALKKLYQRFDGRNPAAMLRKLSEVIKPGEVKQPKDMYKAIENWEIRVKEWEGHYGEVISEKIKLAVLVGMGPKEMQDEAFKVTDP